ncbi:predicted protein [Thalassiosira pseudonana CCMP1335]|uniref:HMG box domain-containing protein n=1 Tax=Thalassiosira pseudonana TaxID=35128 RepID=B8CFC7_THAPS|nr:predicted protein [Thalassiosira pseudonana CCMP1335]EED87778.1 predicted protein [Thalassiosira pseudonana CCMP1335]
MPKQTMKIKNRPLNSYNLFFILERELLLQSKGIDTTKGKDLSRRSTSVYFDDYADLASQFPPLPSRYQSLHLSADWYMHGKDKRTRAHIKTHGVISMKELSRSMAVNWKNVDEDIKEYVTEVARMIKERRDELQYASLLRYYDPIADALVADDIITDSNHSETSTDCFGFCRVIAPAPAVPTMPTWPTFCQVISEIAAFNTTTASVAPSSSLNSVEEVDTPDEEIISMWCAPL